VTRPPPLAAAARVPPGLPRHGRCAPDGLGATTLCASYQKACKLRGLLKDDQEWDNVMREVCEVETHGLRIRELYFSILLNNSPESNRVSNAGVAGVVSSIQTTAVSMPWHERMFRDYWEDMGRGLTDQIDKDIASTPDKLKQALRLLVKHTLDEELMKRTNKTQNLRLKLTPIEATMLKNFYATKATPPHAKIRSWRNRWRATKERRKVATSQRRNGRHRRSERCSRRSPNVSKRAKAACSSSTHRAAQATRPPPHPPPPPGPPTPGIFYSLRDTPPAHRGQAACMR